MRRTIPAIALISMLSGLMPSAQAQLVVMQADFNTNALGPSGGVGWNFDGRGEPMVNVVNTNPEGTNTQNLAFTANFTTNAVHNFGWRTDFLPVTGNTDPLLNNYTLEFDLAVQNTSITAIGGYIDFTIALFGNNGGLYNGQNLTTNVPPSFFPAVGTGYQHYSLSNLNSWGNTGGTKLSATAGTMALAIGAFYGSNTYLGPVEIDVANLRLVLNTNAPPPVPPTMSILPAKPGLRIFAQNSVATYNQEGFGTVDSNQSWVGATPSFPRSYSITFAEFDTVNGYSLYAQFTPNVASINPFVVYSGSNALVWRITSAAGGFTTGIDWKTNSPNAGTPNNALTLTTTSTNGRGTWSLTFSNDTGGTVTAPGGSTASFSLSPEVAAQFANPLTILFGTAPNSPQGYGQYIDISRIAISNVTGWNADDDFTQHDGLVGLDINVWDPAFSLDPGSVIQVGTNTPYWLTWTVPDIGYGLGTKADLVDPNVPWYTPDYYGAGAFAPLTPRVMGTTLKWVLIPQAGMPTLDGFQFGTPATNAFFRLSNPPPAP